MSNFILENKDYIGEEEGKKLYQSIKNNLELVNTIRFPKNFDVSKSFIRGFNNYRDENYAFIFFCDNQEKEKQIREDQKTLECFKGNKIWEQYILNKNRHWKVFSSQRSLKK